MKSNHFYLVLFILVSIPYLLGLFLPLMELDSAQDAVMAMQMAQENSYLELIKVGKPYLDKPHLHFWLSALSFEIFGVYEWSYRLPSVLILILGAFSTYKLGRLLYDSKIGKIAAVFFLTSQTIILSAHDVRTDAVLTGTSITALWLLVDFLKTKNWYSVFFGGVFLGLAFDTKGLIAVVVVGLFLCAHLFYTRSFYRLLSFKNLWGLLGFGLAISPVLYAYHYQFDSHPELVISGQNNVSGVKFILWDQVFNRLNAKGFDETSPDYFFFFHTILWTFLPYSILFYTGVFNRMSWFVKNRFKYVKSNEFLSLGGVLMVLILISFSKFKLPHYLNILMPMMAIFSAGYLINFTSHKIKSILIGIQKFLVCFASITLGYIIFYAFKIEGFWQYAMCILVILSLIWFVFFQKYNDISIKFVVISVCLMVFVNINLNAVFYPKLLDYQGGKKMAEFTEKTNLEDKNILLLNTSVYWSFDFYTKTIHDYVSPNKLKTNDLVLVKQKHIHELEKLNMNFDILKEVNHYRVSRLSLKFIKPNTRDKELNKLYLLQIN